MMGKCLFGAWVSYVFACSWQASKRFLLCRIK
jgi:hypothetical protein